MRRLDYDDRAHERGSTAVNISDPQSRMLLEFFKFVHLPQDLQAISAPCFELAWTMAQKLDGPELEAGLRKLLEAKDCFVRALVAKSHSLAQPTTPDATGMEMSMSTQQFENNAPAQPPVQTTPGRFDYVRYDDASILKQEKLKAKFAELEQLIQEMLPDGRAKSLVFTALEESYMWTGKSLRDQQIKRGGDATHQPARGE